MFLLLAHMVCLKWQEFNMKIQCQLQIQRNLDRFQICEQISRTKEANVNITFRV